MQYEEINAFVVLVLLYAVMSYRKCQKKVTYNEVTREYYCEKCSKSYSSCENRYILKLLIADHTGCHWATAFNDQAVRMMKGKTADELALMKETEPVEYRAIFEDLLASEFAAVIRLSVDESRDERKLQMTILNVKPVDFLAEIGGMVFGLCAL